MYRVLIICVFACLSFSCKKQVTQYYPNGNVRSEVEFKNNLMHGKAVYYHANGNKQLETTYYYGKLNGEMKRWYYDGHIEGMEHYIMDTLNGEFLSYYENGNLKISMSYEKGLKNGKYKELHENGQLKIEGGFVKDMFDGEWKYYDFNGIFSGFGEYTNGTGQHISFYYNTRDTLVKTYFVDNQKHGKEIWFEKNSNIKEVKCYEHGNEIQCIEEYN
jgi:antitoxin component YwqK of YwqJK toxin-antitoxin module